MRSLSILILFSCLLVSIAHADDPVTIPVIYIEQTVATEGPVSVFNVPDGSGKPLSAAFGPGGTVVDATITMALYDNLPGAGGQRVAHFPFEDMWLMSGDGLLLTCMGGSVADADTDLNGVTTWATTLFAGGQADPDVGGDIYIMISGVVPEGNPLIVDMRMNSADINGDGEVLLGDVQVFAEDFYGPYTYRSDFVWDGMVNLSDLAELAKAIGTACP